MNTGRNSRTKTAARGLLLALSLGAGLVSPACVTSGGSDPEPEPTCSSDSDCDDGRHCDPLRGCVACLFDHQCDEGEACIDRTCQHATACDSNADCDSGPAAVCDPDTLVCVECIASSDCPTESRCEGRRCIEVTP